MAEETFKQVILAAVNTLSERHESAYGVYFESSFDAAIVHLCVEDNSNNVHARMAELHTALWAEAGVPWCLSHNSPTDGHILVTADSVVSAALYDKSSCCRNSLLKSYVGWITNGRPEGLYTKEWRAIFKAVDAIADNTDTSAAKVFDRLDFDREVAPQLLEIFISL